MPTDLKFATELSHALRHVLREAREAAALSLGELAARSGLNRQAITFIENGDRRPTTETFSRLAMSLGLKPSEAWAKAEAKVSSLRFRKVMDEAERPAL